MPRYVFHLEVRDGHADRLREINDRYAEVLRTASANIEGLRGIEKYLFGDQYVELIDYAGEFAEFAKQLGADPQARQFMREVNDCFTTPLKTMTERQMTVIQTIP